MNVTLVHNPNSGTALSPRELKKQFRQAGIMITRLVPIKDGFERQLEAPIRNGERIAAIGGDGTLNSVAGLLVGTKAVFIPLSGGTFNNFTKDAGVPQDLAEALARLKTAKIRQIDIGEVNGSVFLNNSSVGLYPQTLQFRETHETTIGKWPAMVAAAARAVVRFRPLRVTIDGTTYKTPFVFVGNNRYATDNIGLTERTRLDEGALTVLTARVSSRLGLLKVGFFILIGRAQQLREFAEYHPTSLTIDTRRATLAVSRDGEVSQMTAPIEYRVRKKSLRIL